MFGVNSLKQLRQIAKDIGQGNHSFSEDAEVWRGDDGSFLIGDESEFDPNEEMTYVLAGTLGEYRPEQN